jgi:hypothetical protein
METVRSALASGGTPVGREAEGKVWRGAGPVAKPPGDDRIRSEPLRKLILVMRVTP